MLKPRFLVCSWIGDGYTEYNNAPCWPPKFVYGLLDLSVDRERRGWKGY